MTEDAGNMWRHKGTCICWERLVYHSYDWFTIYSNANHCRDILSKILCGQNEKVSKFTARGQEHKRKADLTSQKCCSLKTSLHSASCDYLTLLYLQIILQFSKNFEDFSFPAFFPVHWM